MASYNRVILMGNVTRDLEIRYIPSGTAVMDLGLAVSEKRKNNKTDEWIEETVFVDVTLWGRTAEIAGEYLSKGSPVFIDGRLRYETWEQDGQKRSKLKVVCDRMQLIGGRSGGGGGGGGGQQYNQQPQQQQQYNQQAQYSQQAPSGPPQDAPPTGPPDDDIPF